MTIAFETIKGDKKIPGAIHQSDGTTRAQLLSKDENPELWNLIYAFYKKLVFHLYLIRLLICTVIQ